MKIDTHAALRSTSQQYAGSLHSTGCIQTCEPPNAGMADMPAHQVKSQVSFLDRFLEPVSLTEVFGLIVGNIQKVHTFPPEFAG